jgi:hypothetical protein
MSEIPIVGMFCFHHQAGCPRPIALSRVEEKLAYSDFSSMQVTSSC